MYIEKAIDLANEHGGYSWHVSHWYEAMIDPEFWQSLGKYFVPCSNMDTAHSTTKYMGNEEFMWVFDWKQQWHLFIDHLAEGKDAESFFEQLLTK